MTEQQIDRDELLAWCRNRPSDDGLTTMYNHELRYIVDALDQAEAELDSWMARAYDAEGKLWKAEARIRHLEDTAQVLVKEALDAENARDESRRGKAEAEARIKAVQHLIDQADEMGEWAITCTRLQWAIDGSAPRPSA